MEAAIKIIEILVPLIIEVVKAHHPDKTEDEHKEIAKDLVAQAFQK